MKKLVTLIILSLSLLATTAHAAEWASGTYKIKYIEPTTGGWTWVGLDRPTNLYKENVCGTQAVQLHGGDCHGVLPGNTTEARSRIYSGLVSAMLAGKSMRIRVAVNPNNNECVIERVRIHQ